MIRRPSGSDRRSCQQGTDCHAGWSCWVAVHAKEAGELKGSTAGLRGSCVLNSAARPPRAGWSSGYLRTRPRGVFLGLPATAHRSL